MISYEEGVRLKTARAKQARQTYRPRHTAAEYLEFIRSQSAHFDLREEHPQSDAPGVYVLFTVPSQHVFGDCLEELLDKAIERTAKDGTPRVRIGHGRACYRNEIPEGTPWRLASAEEMAAADLQDFDQARGAPVVPLWP